ncbi:Variable major outer membrane lipoprotein, partial [Borrelia duttonii CR2A]
MNIEKKGEGKVRVIIMMVMMMVMMGCNSGGVKGEGTAGGGGSGLSGAMMEVGRSAERVFYAFIELMSDVLGFTAKVDTKKSDVGNYFNSLGVKLGEATKELEEVAKKSETDTNKGDLSKDEKNAIREAVDAAKGVLDTLKGYLESLKGIGDGTIVGEAVTGDAAAVGTAGDESSLVAIIKALKLVVQVSEKENVGKLSESDTTLSINGIDNKNGVKILATKMVVIQNQQMWVRQLQYW